MVIEKNLQDIHNAQETLDTEKSKIEKKVGEVFQRYMNALVNKFFVPYSPNSKPYYKKHNIDHEDWHYHHSNSTISVRHYEFEDIEYESLPVEYLFDEEKLVEFEKECEAIKNERVQEFNENKKKRDLKTLERLQKEYGENDD